MNAYQHAQHIGSVMKGSGRTLSICESCTGGMLGSTITSVPGSSRYFIGGVIAYSNNIKIRLIGVRRKTLEDHGAVSGPVAQEMAQGVCERLGTDIGLSITGIAGPAGGTRNKPTGLVYIGIALKKKVIVRKFTFKGSRKSIRQQACHCALHLLDATMDTYKTSWPGE